MKNKVLRLLKKYPLTDDELRMGDDFVKNEYGVISLIKKLQEMKTKEP